MGPVLWEGLVACVFQWSSRYIKGWMNTRMDWSGSQECRKALPGFQARLPKQDVRSRQREARGRLRASSERMAGRRGFQPTPGRHWARQRTRPTWHQGMGGLCPGLGEVWLSRRMEGSREKELGGAVMFNRHNDHFERGFRDLHCRSPHCILCSLSPQLALASHTLIRIEVLFSSRH